MLTDRIYKLLLQKDDLTLDKSVQICQLHELAESDNKVVKWGPDINAIE